jgi:hypothetical protein
MQRTPAARHSEGRDGGKAFRSWRRSFLMPGMGGPTGPSNGKIGFNTIAMWGLCIVVVGVCYAIEYNEKMNKPPAPPGIPSDVKKVLPSGMWLMRDGSIINPAKRQG